jgi:hypothetical protein
MTWVKVNPNSGIYIPRPRREVNLSRRWQALALYSTTYIMRQHEWYLCHVVKVCQIEFTSVTRELVYFARSCCKLLIQESSVLTKLSHLKVVTHLTVGPKWYLEMDFYYGMHDPNRAQSPMSMQVSQARGDVYLRWRHLWLECNVWWWLFQVLETLSTIILELWPGVPPQTCG